MAKRQWLKLERQVLRNIKIRKLALRLRVKPAVAVGHLVALWSSAFDREETEWGDLSSLGAEGIAINAEWDDDPEQFLQALVDVGLLDQSPSFDVTRKFDVTIHDWDEYAGPYLRNREKSRLRMQNMRERNEPKKQSEAKKKRQSSVTRNVTRKCSQTPLRSTEASSVSGDATSSNQTPPSAARAVRAEGDALSPFTPNPKATAISQKKRAASRSAGAPKPTSPQGTAHCSPEKPTPSTQSFVASRQTPALPPTNTYAAGAIAQSPARHLAHQQTSAIDKQPPVPEICDQRGLSKARIEDAFRTRWPVVVRCNTNTRTQLRELTDKHAVTEQMLDQAYQDACTWHAEQGNKVHGTTIVQMLGTIAHHEAKAAQQHPAEGGQPSGHQGEAMFTLPDGTTAGRVFFTAKEQESMRAESGARQILDDMLAIKQKYGVKL